MLYPEEKATQGMLPSQTDPEIWGSRPEGLGNTRAQGSGL